MGFAQRSFSMDAQQKERLVDSLKATQTLRRWLVSPMWEGDDGMGELRFIFHPTTLPRAFSLGLAPKWYQVSSICRKPHSVASFDHPRACHSVRISMIVRMTCMGRQRQTHHAPFGSSPLKRGSCQLAHTPGPTNSYAMCTRFMESHISNWGILSSNTLSFDSGLKPALVFGKPPKPVKNH